MSGLCFMWTILRVYMSDFEFDQKYPGHAHVNANDDVAEGLFGAGPFYEHEIRNLTSLGL